MPIRPLVFAALLVPLLAVAPGRAEDAKPAAPAAPADAKWTPLFNGKDLTGWHKIGTGEWTVEDGAIVGRHKKTDKEYGHLVTDKSYEDFAVRLKFKSVAGNSGLYFRIDENPKKFSG